MVDRATIFGSEAARYDEVRPRYPASVIDLVVAGGPDVAVDAGCGTGIASQQVAGRGVRVMGVEPDVRMAAVARGRGIDVTVSSFEQWEVQPCDAVFAAQSWHWIDPTAGADVAARSIRPGGRWIAFWNHEIDTRVDELVVPVYERHAPHLVEERSIVHAANSDFAARIDAGLAATEAFTTMTVEHIDWVDRVDGATFVERLGSHSSHRLLDDGLRRAIHEQLLEAVGETTRLDLAYRTEVFICERRE